MSLHRRPLDVVDLDVLPVPEASVAAGDTAFGAAIPGEPCTMCMSAITWTGFDNFYYFFSHEVFGLEPGGYHRTNAFWTAYSIPELVDAEDDPALHALAQPINGRYAVLSRRYQDTKGGNDIPLS